MGILNRVVNIVILVLALASAAFSFLLFQKREVFVDGWNKLTSTINSTASELDKGSGTKSAAKLTAATLDHTKYEELDKLLPELKKQASEVAAQRNTLAGALKEVATTLEIDTPVETTDLQNIASYSAKKDEVLGSVAKIQERDNGLIKDIRTVGTKVGVSLDEKALKGPDAYKAETSKLNAQVDRVKTRVDKYSENLKQVAQVVGATPPPASEEYPAALKDISTKVTTLKSDYTQAVKEKENLKTEVAKLQTSVDKLGQESNEDKNIITTQKKEIGKLQGEIRKLAGTTDDSDPLNIATEGDPKNLRLLKGKIVEVSKKWDFVVIDLGARNDVEQTVGQKKLPLKVFLPNNEDMLVARELNGDKSEFVGRIRLVKVYDTCSIANVLPSPMGTNSIKPGDIVFFSDDTIDKIINSSKKKTAATDAAATPAEEKAVEKKEEKNNE
ncbi:MAG: hypothetical protein A2017_20235 [Lentisphaerae bacterium GWF2_44_16]|nr:MAG: hypothetical protein A2017_20235 [Lentisphaerae bacterium GWF2_44_16]